MRTRYPIYGRAKEFSRVRTEFGITEKSKTGVKAPGFAVTQKTLPDGSRVKLTTIGAFADKSTLGAAGSPMQPSMRLARVNKATGGESSVSCDLLSGFFDITNPLTVLDDGYLSRVAFKAAGGMAAWTNSEDMIYSWKNMGITTAACSLFRNDPNSITAKLGSNFTGIMRRVVQTLAGIKYPIPYSYCYTTTDGIFVGSDGSHHVIRIDTATGIWAQPVPVCKYLDAEEKAALGTTLDYTPKPILGQWRRIAPASDLSEYASKNPFFIECGWAFSYTGREAQNVMWDEPGTWKRVYRFKMVITGTNKPTGASIEIVEETYLWGERFGGPKFPHFIPNGGGQALLTFDSRSNPPLAGGPPGPAEEAPLFVYFTEGSDTPVVWRQSSLGLRGTDMEDETISADLPVGLRVTCSAGNDYYEISPGAGAGTWGNYDAEYSDNRTYTPTGPITDAADPDKAYLYTGSFAEYWSVQDGGWNYGGFVGPSADRPFSEHWETYRQLTSNGIQERRFYQGFIVPFGNRETAFKYHKEKVITTRSNYTVHASGWGMGTYYLGCRYFSFGASACNPGGALIYKTLLCSTPSDGPAGVITEFGAGADLKYTFNTVLPGPPVMCKPFGEAACYEETETWIPDFGPSYSTSCPISGTNYAGPDVEETEPSASLWVHNNDSGNMEEVKSWDTYDEFDPYTSVTEEAGQVMVSNVDAFTGAGFTSAEMNGYQGDEYYFIQNADTAYPLSDLTAGLDRGWFGVPF